MQLAFAEWPAFITLVVAGIFLGGLHVKNTSQQNELICGLYTNTPENIYTID